MPLNMVLSGAFRRALERPCYRRLTANPIQVEVRGFLQKREKLVAMLIEMLEPCMPATVQKKRCTDSQSHEMN